MEFLKILCIDDSATMRAVVKSCFKDDQIKMLWAEDGLEGLAQTWAERPNVILVDMLMPKISGTRLCEIIKSNKELSSIPLYVLTSRGGPIDRESIALSGADGYFQKPLNRAELRDKIFAGDYVKFKGKISYEYLSYSL